MSLRAARERLVAADRRAAAAFNAPFRGHRRALAAALFAERLAPVQILLMLALLLARRPLGVVRSLAAVTIVYWAVELVGRWLPRERPFSALGGVHSRVPHGSERSFPSRHSASAVAMATIAEREHPGIGRIMYAVAVALGLARVASGMHYPSDVLAGAALGRVVGLALRAR